MAIKSGSTLFNALRLGEELSDEAFDSIYPKKIKRLAGNHFTPVSVAIEAARFLVSDSETKVLDIGSGAGKFCMVGSACTSAHFTGIEQRKDMVELSVKLANAHQLRNLSFINGNVTSIDFTQFDAFYLYNSFQENIDTNNKMDDSVLVNPSLYNAYMNYTVGQLSLLPVGTRLATYYTSSDFIPKSFIQIKSLFDGQLKLWEML